MAINNSAFNKILNAPVAAGFMIRHLGKLVPALNPFLSGAVTAGYGASEIVDFLRNKFNPESQQRETQQLEQRAQQGIARPDERANLSVREQARGGVDTASMLARKGLQIGGGLLANKLAPEEQSQVQTQEQPVDQKGLARIDQLIQGMAGKMPAATIRDYATDQYGQRAVQSYEAARGPIEQIVAQILQGQGGQQPQQQQPSAQGQGMGQSQGGMSPAMNILSQIAERLEGQLGGR